MPILFVKEFFVVGAVPDDLAPSDQRKWCLIPGIAVKAAGGAHPVARAGTVLKTAFEPQRHRGTEKGKK